MHTLIRKLDAAAAGDLRFAWRSRDPQGWCTAPAVGTAAQLHQAGVTDASLVLEGTTVVCTRLALKPAERRHLHALAAFELEDAFVASPETIHVAGGPDLGGTTALAYTDKASLMADIAAIEALGITVRHAVPLPLLLPREDSGWTLADENGLVHVHHAPGQGFSIESALAGPALQRLLRTGELPTIVTLYAPDAAGLGRLGSLLEAAWSAATAGAGSVAARLRRQQATLWDILQEPARASIDLRQGDLACPLPWARWWQQARATVLLAGIAVAVHVCVQGLQVLQLDRRYENLQQQSTSAYRNVIPDGVLVDAEQQLRSQLAQFEAGAAGDVLALLEVVAPLLAARDNMSITRLSWQGQQGEVQLSLLAQSNSDILAVAEALQAAGLDAQARNMSRQGQLQTANLVLRKLNR